MKTKTRVGSASDLGPGVARMGIATWMRELTVSGKNAGDHGRIPVFPAYDAYIARWVRTAPSRVGRAPPHGIQRESVAYFRAARWTLLMVKQRSGPPPCGGGTACERPSFPPQAWVGGGGRGNWRGLFDQGCSYAAPRCTSTHLPPPRQTRSSNISVPGTNRCV